MYRFYTLVITAFILSTFSISFAANPETKAKEPPVRGFEPAPEPAPNFSATSVDGGKVTLKSLRGKGVIVNFWATWCPPCKAEMPAFDNIYKKYKDDGIVVYGINYGETEDIITEYLMRAPVSFPILFDKTGDIGAMFDVFALPSTYFIDRNGNFIGRVMGALDERYLEEWVKKLKAAKRD